MMANETMGKVLTNNVLLANQYDGYAYMMFGTESVTYKEKASILPIESSVTASNVAQMSGGLTKVNDRFDFSIDTVSTLLSQTATEQWRMIENFGGISSGTLLQQNSFDLITSKLKILLHYKQTNNWRFVVGPAYSLDTFKRYNWQSKHASIVADSSVQEERYASLQAHAGVAYESYTAATNTPRYNLRATYGHPLWQKTTNTNEKYKDVSFTNASGYNIDLDGYFGYPVTKGVELGIYGGFALQHREGDVTDVDTGTSILRVEWPENDLTFYRMGMMFVWKFRE